MTQVLVKIDWVESERGWGQRPDGTLLCLDMSIAKRYIEKWKREERERNPSGKAPEYYSFPDTPVLIHVPDEVFNYVLSLPDKVWWVTSTNWWNPTDSYTIPKKEEPKVETKPLTEYSIEELEEALRKKKAVEEMPKPRQQVDVEAIVKIAVEHITDLAAGNTTEDDEQYIYETVMQAVYGNDIFGWINKQKR